MKSIEAIADGPTSDSESYITFVDSQAALTVNASVWHKSRLQGVSRTFGPDCIRQYQVPGQSGIPGNETADALARLSSFSDFDLVVGRDPQFATSMALSIDGSEGKSRGIG